MIPVGLQALGADLRIEIEGERAAAVESALRERWALCAGDPDAPGCRVIRVEWTDGPEQLDEGEVRSANLPRLLQLFTQAVTHQAIAANFGRLLMLHAAAIAHPDTGAGFVGVAPGGIGKTTFCRRLAPDWGYLSDETVGVRADGGLVPYPKPLSIRRSGQEVKDETDPRSLGLRVPQVPVRLTGLVLLARSDAHQGAARIEELDAFDAIGDLVPETSSLHLLPEPLHLLDRLLSGLGLLARVHYREAEALRPLITEVIG